MHESTFYGSIFQISEHFCSNDSHLSQESHKSPFPIHEFSIKLGPCFEYSTQ